MRSLNSWLGFSLSPHHTLDEPDCSKPQSSITSLSVAPTKMSESSIGYDGSSDGYGITQDTLTCSEIPDMPLNSDGSLSIMEAFRQTHCGVPWPSNTMPATANAIQPSSMLPSEHMQLPTCFSTLEGSNHQICSEMQFSIMQAKTEQEGPKLEDFLGGVSLGGRFSGRSNDQPDLESLYYASNHADLCRQKLQPCRSFLQSPFEDMQAPDPLQLHEISESRLPLQAHSLFTRQEDDRERNVLCSNVSNGRPKYAQNLLHEESFFNNAHESFFPDCVMQPVSGSSAAGSSTTTGISALKTWLRQHQNSAEKTELSSSCSSANDHSKMANVKTLALTMSPASQSSSIAAPQMANSVSSPTDSKKRNSPKAGLNEPTQRKSIDTFGQRTSIYRGVTRHRWTGRYEAHLWDNSSRKEGQTRKGRQGGYDKEEKAARSYDLAALKYWGPTTTINFPLATYEKELEEMKNMTRLEYVASLRRKSSGFSRGASIYRGVTRHHQQGRWQARIGRVAGNKDLYLGTFSTQEEAAEAYDIAAIKFRGINAVTNFEINRYDLKRICSSPSLVSGDTARPSKENEASERSKNNQQIQANGILQLHGSIQSDTSYKGATQNWQIALPLQCRDIQQQDDWAEQEHHANCRDLASLPDTAGSYENFLKTTSMPSAVLRNIAGLDGLSSCDNSCSNRIFTDQSFTDPLLMGSAYSTTCERSRRSAIQSEEGNPRETPVNYSLQADLSQPYLYLSQQQATCIKPNYENNMLSSFMTPTMQINQERPILAAGNMPMFAVWNDN
ncbi:hypothetical protein O6H91_02G053300 [Diphasiastrum complanatum]|uniref:Uncharacterized protein n=1 Tax=Diphasiastrum complanatum TaxID=34168 RepID=A0ACC2EFE1_DIPCM|nr:hypothetical protein O6H91_02G053300 [Diphasiastrum complanatum]